MAMIRKQVYIESSQDKRLKALAKELHVTEAELIRQGIDRGVVREAAPRPDAAAWDEAERYIARRRRRKVLSRTRRWTRKDLYGR